MIEAPIAYCEEDQTLVASFDALPPEAQSGDYWSDNAVNGLRSRVKTFYIAAQKTRCCYCNRHLGTRNHRNWDVEHIASRVDHVRFMFEPLNLAASCVDCNLKKSEKDPFINKEALANPKRKSYPTKSKDFRIVHPHFDEYGDHIYQSGMVYLGKTEKGKSTIYACDLLRFAQKFINWEASASDTSFEKDVDLLFQKGSLGAEKALDSLVAQLTEE